MGPSNALQFQPYGHDTHSRLQLSRRASNCLKDFAENPIDTLQIERRIDQKLLACFLGVITTNNIRIERFG